MKILLLGLGLLLVGCSEEPKARSVSSVDYTKDASWEFLVPGGYDDTANMTHGQVTFCGGGTNWGGSGGGYNYGGGGGNWGGGGTQWEDPSFYMGHSEEWWQEYWFSQFPPQLPY